MKVTRRGQLMIGESPAKLVPLESRPHLFKASCVIAWSVWLLYFVYQVLLVHAIQSARAQILWRIWIVLLAEFCLSFQELVLAFSTLLGLFTPGRKTDARPNYKLSGQSAPSVDVLITCCGEPVDVIVDTARAAAAQDYPSDCFRVLVLDDGHDDDIRQAIDGLGTWLADSKYAKVVYLSRSLPPGAKSFFKAGNLKFGIDESCRLGSSDFIAGLDADMIPEPQWLRKLIPHLILDDRVGVAVGPQVGLNSKSLEVSLDY